jgi:hypothetical protein
MQKFQDINSGQVKANFVFTRNGWVVSVSNFFNPKICDVGVWVDGDNRSDIKPFQTVNDAIDFCDNNLSTAGPFGQ